jgi:chloride channel protein, CIC family
MRAIQAYLRRSQALLEFWKPGSEQIKIAALQWLLRLAPSERQRVFALTLPVGALCGLAAVAFHLTIRIAEGLLIDRALSASGSTWMLWTLVLPTLGGVISGALPQVGESVVAPAELLMREPTVTIAVALSGANARA